MLSECNNILKEQIVFIFKYETIFVSHSFLLQKHQYGLSLGYSLVVCCHNIIVLYDFPTRALFQHVHKIEKSNY